MPELSPAWRQALDAHLVQLHARHRSQETCDDRRRHLTKAFAWFRAGDLAAPSAVSFADVEAYAAALAAGPRQPATCRNHLTALRIFFRELRRSGLRDDDPTDRLILPPPSRALPRTVFSSSELDRLRTLALHTGRNRVRNRAIVEVLYATGLRRAECAALAIGDVDFQRESVFVRFGKGRRQRVVPIAQRALRWIALYLRRERRLGRRELGSGSPLFAGWRGRALSFAALSDAMRKLVVRAGIGKPGACHAFRHTMATHMLDHGADIRHIQAMLGHADISTTMRYTHVSIRGLAEVYRRTHPAAFMRIDRR